MASCCPVEGGIATEAAKALDGTKSAVKSEVDNTLHSNPYSTVTHTLRNPQGSLQGGCFE